MAKDPAFLFYPGDYLRDTQCLSEKAQVAYDRIMCEHMRNICKDVSKIGISQDQLNFFTKRLTEDEKSDLMHVLVKIDVLYQIEWVALSICKRKTYSDGRAENRRKKEPEHMKTYVSHMENENEIVCIRVIKELESNKLLNGESETEKKELAMVVIEMEKMWLKHKPEYSSMQMIDYPALLSIAYHIAGRKGWTKHSVTSIREQSIIQSWEKIVLFLSSTNSDNFLKRQTLDGIANPKIIQKIEEAMKQADNKRPSGMIL